MDNTNTEQKTDILVLASEIVAAYVSGNQIAASEIPGLINTIHTALANVGVAPKEEVAPLVPAVAIKKSITPDYVICLEDGKKFKSLKRHIRSAYGLSPADYRAKWGLPADYPMVAPNYAAARSNLAKAMGLGQQRKKAAAPIVEAAPAKATKKRAPKAKKVEEAAA